MFVKGQKKPAGSGRAKGTGNFLSRKIWEGLHKQLLDLDFDALAHAVKMIRSKRVPTEIQARLLAVILQLQFPKQTSVTLTKKPEISRADWNSLVSNQQLAKLMQAATFKIAEIAPPPRQIAAPQAHDTRPPIIDAEPVDGERPQAAA